MIDRIYYLTVNKKTGEHRCDGVYWSNASCRRHTNFVVNQNNIDDWAMLLKKESEEPLSTWEVNLSL